MLVLLYGFLSGDTLGLVVLVHDDEPVSQIASSLQQAASMRVRPSAKASVYFNGVRLDSSLTVGQAGLKSIDRVDVVQEDADGA